jgi:hypothetical protein
MSKLFLKGKTKRYNLKSPTEHGITHWINVCMFFDQNGIITGSGISLINKKVYPFEIFGTKKDSTIEFVKIHPEIKSSISYKGILKDNQIELISNHSSGVLNFIH